MSDRRKHRKRRRFAHRTPPGAPPGTLAPTPGATPPIVEAIAYGPQGYVRTRIENLAQITELREKWPVVWINVDGLGDTTFIAEIGQYFGFHRLALEDVVHVHQRPKVDSYGDTLFIVAQMPHDRDNCSFEQITMFLGAGFVVTFQEHPGGDCLDAVRVRIETGYGKLWTRGADLLAYALLDAIIDHYFPHVESVAQRLEAIEDELLGSPRRGLMNRLHLARQDLVALRRSIWPLRDAMNTLLRDNGPLIQDETRVYLRDCHDHTIQLIDLIESYRDLAGGLSDLYLSLVGYRTNEVMRLLTVISTIFIPLTFIVGVYGMNFDPDASPWNMPELRSRWGYPVTMAAMALLALMQIVYYWRKGWLGRPERADPTTSREPPRSG